MGKFTSKGKHTAKVGNHPHKNMISKPAIVRRGQYKCRILEMHLKLKQSCIYRERETATSKPYGNHKPKIYNRHTHTHTQKKAIQTQHSRQSPNHKRREQKKKGRKKTYQKKSKTINKMAIRTYISVNGLNAPKLNMDQGQWGG